jgi:tetratricopeptide (TPR) repeat protein
LSVALILSLTQPARADERAKARAAFHNGLRHYNLGEFTAALESFKEAYRHFDDPSFLFNIGQCERQVGHKKEAIREYRAFLNNATHPDNVDVVRATIRQLEKELAADEEAERAAAAPKPEPTAPAAVTPTPSPAPVAAAASLTASAPPPVEHEPAYKKWWVWTIVGGVVAAGAAAGVAVALTRPATVTAPTTLGTQHPF